MAEFTIEPKPLEMNLPDTGAVIKNLKELKISDGKVRIVGGAIIISDENGVDRVLIGYQKDGF